RRAPAAGPEPAAQAWSRPRAKPFVPFPHALPPDGAARGRPLVDARPPRPGDLIAWNRPADSKSTNTGHVMVVAGETGKYGRRGLRIPIFDSTAARHGAGDTRAAGSPTGVGSGTIVLLLDKEGHPKAFRWAPSGTS